MVDSHQAANRLAAKLRSQLRALTIGTAIDEWEASRQRAGCTRMTIYEQISRVRAMLASVIDLQMNEVTVRKAAAVYEQMTKEPRRKTGRPLSAASHRHYLALIRALWAWAVKQGHAASNPWMQVEPIGKPSTGKPQLRWQEARRFAELAEQEAAAGSRLALAALCCLSLGLRASESLSLTARDVDAESGELYVNGTKTAAARRRIKLPFYLATLLTQAAHGRPPAERLCNARRQKLHSAVIALCARAGVPRVCVHGLRGTHASLAVEGGASVEAVARVLGHTSTAMTLGHYISGDAATGARLSVVSDALNRS
jgi:integrase